MALFWKAFRFAVCAGASAGFYWLVASSSDSAAMAALCREASVYSGASALVVFAVTVLVVPAALAAAGASQDKVITALPKITTSMHEDVLVLATAPVGCMCGERLCTLAVQDSNFELAAVAGAICVFLCSQVLYLSGAMIIGSSAAFRLINKKNTAHHHQEPGDE